MKTLKRALVTSTVAMLLCFAMLLGTTYAWFTDTAASKGNKIEAGDLDVDLYMWTSATTSIEITDTAKPIFGADSLLTDNGLAIEKWEPGTTQIVYLSIKNDEDNLDLKYKVALSVYGVTANLHEALVYDIIPDATFGSVTAWDATAGTAVVKGANETEANDVTLKDGEEHFFALAVHMLEDAGNEYKNGTVTFDINVIAGQLASELNSFGKSDYDVLAGYPGTGYAAPITGTASAAEILITGEDGAKVGSVTIPKAAADSAATKLTANITESDYVGNFTVAAGMEVTKYDVSVEGLKADNDTPVKVMLRIAAGLDPDTVALYHYDTKIDSTYNPNTGYVTFETTSFSPFTVVYDADSKYEAPEVEESAKMPKATVTYLGVNAGEESIPWGSYGQWSPTEGLEANLEASFKFACPDYENATAEEKAVIDAYRYWYCDFVVSLSDNLAANQIFLGGNYGSFGWVGFHNGELELEANTEIPLLGSVTSNPWTYDDVENNVGEFICGVGDVNNALEGDTFTVKLRLTNPENENEYYDVNVVTYVFGGDYNIK